MSVDVCPRFHYAYTGWRIKLSLVVSSRSGLIHLLQLFRSTRRPTDVDMYRKAQFHIYIRDDMYKNAQAFARPV